MKRLRLSFLLCLAPLLCAAQGRVAYTYDEAGNRISRQIVVPPAAQNASRAALKTGIDGTLAPDQKLRLTAWPLPAKEVLHVRAEGMNPTSVCVFSLFSAAGSKMLTESSGKTAVTLSLTGVPKGHYFLQVESEGKTTVMKITKE